MATLVNQVFTDICGLYQGNCWRKMGDVDANAEKSAVVEAGAVVQRWAAAVVMERMSITNRWATEKWEAKGVLPDLTPGAAPRLLMDTPQRTQVLFSGLDIRLHRDEAEGYYMNITSPQPKVFVLWRMGERVAEPQMLTVSYHEGSRWLDSGETVDGVALPVELVGWMAAFCEQHYRPEPRKKTKYATSKDKGRMGNWRPDE